MRTPAPGSGRGLSLGGISVDADDSAAQRLTGLAVAIAVEVGMAWRSSSWGQA